MNLVRFSEDHIPMPDLTPLLPGLSPVAGKSVVAKFDGGQLSSDGGWLLLRETEQRLQVAERPAACIKDPRAPDLITHSLADIIRFRLLMIAAGYEDGNDASSLRSDPMFKMALDLAPSDRELCRIPEPAMICSNGCIMRAKSRFVRAAGPMSGKRIADSSQTSRQVPNNKHAPGFARGSQKFLLLGHRAINCSRSCATLRMPDRQ
jgi:hypothetical protein